MYVYKDLLTLCTLFSLIFFFFDFHFFNSIAFFFLAQQLAIIKAAEPFFKKDTKKRDCKKKVLNGSKQQQREEFFFHWNFKNFLITQHINPFPRYYFFLADAFMLEIKYIQKCGVVWWEFWVRFGGSIFQKSCKKWKFLNI